MNVTDAALNEAAGQQAAVGEMPGSIFLADRRRLLAYVKRVQRGKLHAIGRLHRLDAAFQIFVGSEGLAVLAVECLLGVELPPLSELVGPLVLQIRNHVHRIELGAIKRRALMLGGEEAAACRRPAAAYGDKGG